MTSFLFVRDTGLRHLPVPRLQAPISIHGVRETDDNILNKKKLSRRMDDGHNMIVQPPYFFL